jgi:hypothetical protein
VSRAIPPSTRWLGRLAGNQTPVAPVYGKGRFHVKQILFFVLSALLLARTARPAPWALATCGPRDPGQWEKHANKIRHAWPGTEHYLPKPFPKTAKDVIEDYRYQYRKLRSKVRSPDPQEAAVQDAFRTGSIRVEVLRVETWSPLRCALRGENPYSYLLRTFHSRTGVELSQTILDWTGELAQISNTSPEQRAEPIESQQKRLPSPEDVLRDFTATFHLTGQDPQYVTTWGTLECMPTVPCVAFRQGEDVYIVSLRGEGTFKVPGDGKRFVMKTDVIDRTILPTSTDERLVSIGGRVFAVAHKVTPRP